MAYTKAMKDGQLPARKPTKEEIELKERLAEKGYKTDLHAATRQNLSGMVNLDNLDVHRLTNELISKYNQNNDVGIIQSWFSRNKVKVQESHLQAVLSKVNHIREHSRSLIEYKAELMTQQQALENLIICKIEESEFSVERQREDHQTYLNQQAAERERVWLELDSLKNENDRAKYEAEKAKWEAEESKNKAWITELRGKLIEKIIDELKFSDINMKQVFVLIEMIKEADTDSDILGAEARWEQLKAEAKRTMAQADQEETRADWERYKFKQDSKKPD